MAYESFEELKVWQECREFRKSITLLTKSFPAEEKYRLTNQILRSSRSVTANIAEGHGRFHYGENIQSCRQARGSLTETLDHLIVAQDDGHIDNNKMEEMRKKYSRCLGLLNGYIAYLKGKKSDDK